MPCTATCAQPSPTNAHCAADCHETFGSVSGFDRHRRGGECLDPATLAMHRDRNGIWRMDGQRSDLYADSRSQGTPQTAESPPGVGPDANTPPEAVEIGSGGVA